MYDNTASITQALLCITVPYNYYDRGSTWWQYKARVIGAIVSCTMYSEICITHHPYLVAYAFYTIPIFPIFKFEFISLPSFLCMHACTYEQSGFVVVVYNVIHVRYHGVNPIKHCAKF